MKAIEEKIEAYFSFASTQEVMALLEKCGLERYKGSISVPEYLSAIERLGATSEEIVTSVSSVSTGEGGEVQQAFPTVSVIIKYLANALTPDIDKIPIPRTTTRSVFYVKASIQGSP